VTTQTLPFGSWSHPLKRFSSFDSGAKGVVLRTARERGSIERVGKMCERTWMTLGTEVGLEGGRGKLETVREGGSMGGLLDWTLAMTQRRIHSAVTRSPARA